MFQSRPGRNAITLSKQISICKAVLSFQTSRTKGSGDKSSLSMYQVMTFLNQVQKRLRHRGICLFGPRHNQLNSHSVGPDWQQRHAIHSQADGTTWHDRYALVSSNKR